MDGTIIQGIKRLRVLTPCDYDNMDKLVLDLSNALEESSHRLPSNKVKKPWKRRSKSTGSLAVLGSSVPKSSAVSDDSESSLDFKMRHPMELSTCSQPQSDSDDTQKSVRYKQQLTSWRHCSVNIGESDSVNENFHPSRERRKRKFKRMTVDPLPLVKPELKVLSCVSLFPQKLKRVRCLKSAKNKHSKLCDPNLENICDGFAAKASIYCGKRKRSVREKSHECTSCDYNALLSGKTLNSGGTSICPKHLMNLDSIYEKWHEISSSEISSSESDCGVLTNDEESREADDEQSDFFHEPGSTCDISEMEWWEECWGHSKLGRSHDDVQDFLPAAERLRQARRQIRSGRRRLMRLINKQSTTAVGDKKSSDIKEKDEANTNLSKCHETTVGKIFATDIKRRRMVPPLSTSSMYGLENGFNSHAHEKRNEGNGP